MAEKDTPSTELVTYRSNDLASIPALKALMLDPTAAVVTIDDPEAITRQILADIFAAESVEELERKPAEGWANYVDVPVEIRSWVARPSQYENSKVFFVVRAVNMTDGEDLILTTGSVNVIGQIIKLTELGALPVIRVLSEDQTGAGNTVYYLSMTEGETTARKTARVQQRTSEESRAS